jgi:hypothetical protein
MCKRTVFSFRWKGTKKKRTQKEEMVRATWNAENIQVEKGRGFLKVRCMISPSLSSWERKAEELNNCERKAEEQIRQVEEQ